MVGTGCPVAFFFTQNQTAEPLKRFLEFVKEHGHLSPGKVTIDWSHVEVTALRQVFSQCPIQWCVFHVVRAWWNNLTQKVKCASGHDSLEVQQSVLRDLKQMMYEKNVPEMERQVEDLHRKYGAHPNFLAYFQRTWVINDKIKF